MPLRVEFIDEAVEDLHRYAQTGNLPLFLKKLIRSEAVGKNAGLPLGKGLTNWRKIVVGDRNGRIIFTTNPEETVATVWVIGDRDDAQCYETARSRVQALGRQQAPGASLAAVMLQLSETQLTRKSKKRRMR